MASATISTERHYQFDHQSSKVFMMGIDFVSTSADPEEAQQTALTVAWETLSGFRVGVPRQTDLFAYFRTLDQVLAELADSGEIDLVEAIMRHIEYLADKAECHTSVILGGSRFTTPPQIVTEALVNISAVLQETVSSRPELPPEGIPAEVFALILEAEAKLAGWCTREKALTIARIILTERPKTCVEIGVFGGRSLMPCAAALRHNGEGEIYGIEAWSPNVAIEYATNEVNDEWWTKVDYAAIKREFYRFAAATNLTSHLRVIEAPSRRSAGLFDTIDFLHIDGSHSMINAAEDVILYARKVRAGGVVVFDDINWSSTAPARELLGALCDTMMVLKDPENGLDVCAVLRRR
jgi:predicted O-methyltransferase YrrM